MKVFPNKKGQFSIISALLVSIVLATAIITTYSIVRNNPLHERPKVLGAIDEMNLAITHILEFDVGYYGSILQITGNTTYAQKLATDYARKGLESIVYTHPDWSPSFEISHLGLSASWFNRTGYSAGTINVTYSLVGIGVSGINYATSATLKTTVNPSLTSSIVVNVTRDDNKPYSTLTKNNFFFYNYSYRESAWKLTNTGVAINKKDTKETYTSYDLTIPSGIDPSLYMLQVVDYRGITVVASTFSHYTYTLNCDQTLYSTLSNDTVVIEAFQNGTLQWLGQNLKLSTAGKPIPPVPIRCLRINQTVNSVSKEVPFQIEDWGSNYRIPLGVSSNASVFSSKNMLVFLWNHRIENVTLWWDGRDIALQTSYAWKNRYFLNDDWQNGMLTNGILTLRISNGFVLNSTLGSSSVKAEFMRVNNRKPSYGSGNVAYVIHHGIVRDIVQQEAEWSGGVSGCPNFYSQLVVMLPANATYYIYALRTIFVNSSQSRTINDLSPIQLYISCANTKWGSGWGQTLAENGTSGGLPITQAISSTTRLFYNFTSTQTGWMHHWSEFVKNNNGGGIMCTNASNTKLFAFDKIAAAKTGAFNVTDSINGEYQNVRIELNPVERYSASFRYPLDITWHGAVVNFDGTDPIYPSSGGNKGLWILVENPPTVTIN